MRTLVLAVMTMLTLGTAHAAAPRTAVLDVANMTCPTCRITIEAALRRDKGVLASRVDTETGMVSVQFDPDATNAARVAKAITDAGFPAKARTHDK